MPYPLPLTRTEAYLAYKAGVIQQSDLKPSLSIPRNGIDAWLAYWTGLAADYPKREDGTPHILQEEEAYIAYLCGVINEYPEKCLRRVGAYLRYLISARWGRPDHPLNREELYLSLIKTQFIPSGDPSSDIEIDGTAKAAFVDVKMYGDTFQQSYTGKNLANTYGMVEATTSGLTITKGSDGAIIINGTQTATCNIRINETELFAGLVGEELTISVSTSGTGVWSNFGIKTPNTSIIAPTGPNSPTITRTLITSSSGEYWLDLYIANSGTTFTDFKLYLQVEKGSIATSYEPYVGGTPSPNPEYPQTVQTVTGSQTVTVTGKNIFDGQLEIGGWTTNTGRTCTYVTNNNAYRCINPIPVKPSSTYSFSVNGARFDGFRAIFCDSNMTVLSSVVVNNTIVTPADCAYITFYSSALKTQFPNLSDIKTSQIEKGTDVSAYVPYSSNDYEINLGKNLFNQNDVVNGIPSASDGSIISTSSAGRTSDYIPVMANTSYSHTGHPAGWATIAWYKADKSFIARVDGITTTTSPNEAAYARVSCAQSNLDTCQFEAGEPTEYAPYFTPIELCKLGNYQDYIWKDQDKWKIHKETFKHQFDGIGDSWNYASSTTHALQDQNFNVRETGAVKFDVPGVALSKEFIYFPNPGGITTTIPNGCIGFQTSGQYYATFRNDAAFTTKEDAIAWLRDNKPTVYWALATPTDNIITNQALIDQLEALVKGGSEDGTTYIKLSTPEPNLPGLLYVEAAKYI